MCPRILSGTAQRIPRETTQNSILLLSSSLQFLFPANALILGCLTLGGHSSPVERCGVAQERLGFAFFEFFWSDWARWPNKSKVAK
jgi:hypothetical protein